MAAPSACSLAAAAMFVGKFDNGLRLRDGVAD
jgi:hypothetical protein